jgi:hypothetical protein
MEDGLFLLVIVAKNGKRETLKQGGSLGARREV